MDIMRVTKRQLREIIREARVFRKDDNSPGMRLVVELEFTRQEAPVTLLNQDTKQMIAETLATSVEDMLHGGQVAELLQGTGIRADYTDSVTYGSERLV